MVYIKHWHEFHSQSIDLFRKAPTRVSTHLLASLTNQYHDCCQWKSYQSLNHTSHEATDVNSGQATIGMVLLLQIEEGVNGQIAHWEDIRRMLG